MGLYFLDTAFIQRIPENDANIMSTINRADFNNLPLKYAYSTRCILHLMMKSNARMRMVMA